MGTRARGTFAIDWSQTAIDGFAAAPLGDLTLGATWSWNGRPRRLDGPQDLLVLAAAEGDGDLRQRAARRSSRVIGVPAMGGDPRHADPDSPLRDGFTVTDGRRQYRLAMLRDPESGRMLLLLPERMPPPRTELWVASRSEAPPRARHDGPQGCLCFAAGTRIRTPDGERRVEDLVAGDRVLTRDDGAQEIRWTGRSDLTGARLRVQPELCPIRIRAAALGPDWPAADLLVSPRHRLLIRGRAAQALFNTDEVLVRAADLIDDGLIAPVRALGRLRYHHLMLARHQVLWANGMACESFHPAETALDRLTAEQRAGLRRLFPGILDDPSRYGAPARRLLGRAEAAILRHDLPDPLRLRPRESRGSAGGQRVA